MDKMIVLVVLVVIFTIVVAFCSAEVWQEGHYLPDGTYVYGQWKAFASNVRERFMLEETPAESISATSNQDAVSGWGSFPMVDWSGTRSDSWRW